MTTKAATKAATKDLSVAEKKRRANRAFRTARWHRETFLNAIDDMLTVVRQLDDKTLADLVWRGQYAPGRDGFTSSASGERVNGDGGDINLTTVEAAVIARIEALPTPDPAGMAITELLATLLQMSNLACDIDRTRSLLVSLSPPAGRVNSIDLCTTCGKPILGKTHRIDGQPYHAEGSPNCYRQENLRRRGGNAVTDDNDENQQVNDPVDNQPSSCGTDDVIGREVSTVTGG